MSNRPASFAFFDKRGVYLAPRFLDREVCTALRSQFIGGAPASVTKADGYTTVDERSRRTLSVKLLPETEAMMIERLVAHAPTIAARFGIRIRGVQVPHNLWYRRGDYFRAHLDNAEDPRQPEDITARRIAVVVFLNGQTAAASADHYRGGELVFYRLGSEPTEQDTRAILHGEEGLLVAFRTDVFHEVLPVLSGNRYTIVTWYT